ncbi:hypothetical protein [Enterocloster lavalensis]|uniref:hypothetical protein n=1 Tax=Enterocloster lavalensis TaxID=460384 RepID=UPI001D0628B4|nr:hypothetical protein [Enterocloster lavalensis]MCB6343647.1 hypothetical protein [Enterocloster lavalensis]
MKIIKFICIGVIFTLIFPVIIFADDNFENPNPTFELEEDDNSIHVEVHGNIGIPPDYDGELPELETQYETQIDGMDFDIHFDLETTYIEETESEQDDSDDIILPDETLPVETWPEETAPPETRPPETRPPETRPPETRPPETRPPETRPPETRPPETRPPETRPPETRPPETRPPETRPPETRPPETVAPNSVQLDPAITSEIQTAIEGKAEEVPSILKQSSDRWRSEGKNNPQKGPLQQAVDYLDQKIEKDIQADKDLIKDGGNWLEKPKNGKELKARRQFVTKYGSKVLKNDYFGWFSTFEKWFDKIFPW